jgi:hypothetical protein
MAFISLSNNSFLDGTSLPKYWQEVIIKRKSKARAFFIIGRKINNSKLRNYY